MKKTWRCHVCNDIHFGFKSPEICPTCKAKNAYVQVSTQEAQLITGYNEITLDKEGFRAAVENFAKLNEFQVNPDKEKVETLIDGIFNCESDKGMKYCPCRLIEKDFSADLHLVCPCNFLIHETYQGVQGGECWCGLFKKRSKND